MSTHLQSAIEAIKNKNLITAVVEANRAVEENPEDPEAYILRGQISMAVGDKKGAAADMARALELRPELLQQLNGDFKS